MDPKYKDAWNIDSANEFGRLVQGVGSRVKVTDTIYFVHKRYVFKYRFKDIMYRKFVCDIRPTKVEPNRTRLTVRGDRINHPGDCGTPTSNMLLVKMLVNIVISTMGDKFMTGYINNFYLNTPLKQYKNVRLILEDITEEILTESKLQQKATPDGYVYLEIRKVMYGLPQAGLMAQQLLDKILEMSRYKKGNSNRVLDL